MLTLIGVVSLSLGFAGIVHGETGPAYETVTVAPGDTLWEVAANRYPNSDVREKVDQIERANGLKDPIIQPGEIIRVPVR